MPLDIDGAGRSRTLAPTKALPGFSGWILGVRGSRASSASEFRDQQACGRKGQAQNFSATVKTELAEPPKTSDLPNPPPGPPFQGFLLRPLAFQGHRASDPKSFGPQRQACLSMPSKTPRPSQGAFKASGPLQDRLISEPDGQSVDAQP